MEKIALLAYLSPYEGKENVIIYDQGVGDIISGILATHAKWSKEYDKISGYFEGNSPKDIGYNIWKFLKNNVRYKIEPDSRQMLKSPAAILSTHSSDCKNYSLFTGGILAALERRGYKIPWTYRFSSYRIFDKTPQHVFVVIYPGTNREIWVDAVLPNFDQHKKYYYKIDKKPNMSLIALAGVDSAIGKHGDKRRKFFKKLQHDIEKAGKFVLKIGLPLQRKAVLEIFKKNFKGLATHAQDAINKGNRDILTKWKDIGGNENYLISAIKQGASRGKISGDDDTAESGNVSNDTVAHGASFIDKVIDWLKITGINLDAVKPILHKAFDKKKQDTQKAIKDEAEGKETPIGNSVYEAHNSGSKLMPIVLIGGAAVAAYFLMSKRR